MASPTFTRVVPSALAALTVALLAAGTALAQQTSNLESPSRPTTFDVVFGAMQSYGGGGVDLRVSGAVPVTERRSIELFAGVSESGDVLNTQGVYGVQIRRLHGSDNANRQTYTSAGFMGVVTRYEAPDCLYADCDWTSTNHVTPPFLLLLGGGVDFHAKPRLKVHLESQVALALYVPVSVRVGIGVSIPLGHLTSSNRR
jgi:hypothetical protein